MFKYIITIMVAVSSLFACSNLFINKGGYHIVSRTMDFGMNMGFSESIGYVGQENISDVIIDADKIPTEKLQSWKNKYGFVGRAAFSTQVILDGMNTEGVSVAVLYLPGSSYPEYNPDDKRDALSIYNVSNYVLSQAKSVKEAKRLIEDTQIVNGAIKADDGAYLTNIPIHYIIRDRSGDTLVVEFEDKKMHLYHGHNIPVVTNAPELKWQIKHAKKYESLKITNKEANPQFENRFISYKEIYNDPRMQPVQTALLGLPADYTPPSRFVRLKVLVDNMPAPTSRDLAYYQAKSIIDTVVVPPLSTSDVTLWKSIKDLDNGVYMVQDLLYYNPNRTLYAFDVSDGYRVYNLKNLDFSTVPPVGAKSINITPKDEAKKIIDATKALKDVSS